MIGHLYVRHKLGANSATRSRLRFESLNTDLGLDTLIVTNQLLIRN